MKVKNIMKANSAKIKFGNVFSWIIFVICILLLLVMDIRVMVSLLVISIIIYIVPDNFIKYIIGN